ncbi:MAG TPA: hypothetical protein VE445_00265 [Nitrososphaeraceae archaeon]|jgi:hypothetical protein|nr:hypothetical protein [Nitrososphaeraceae archaeon]
MRTLWTPWTPSYSVKKYFKNYYHEEQRWKKDSVKKNISFIGVKGCLGCPLCPPGQYENEKGD